MKTETKVNILPVHTKVIINTGGKNTAGLIVDKKREGTPAHHSHYWKEQDSYLILFDNNTQQYIPSKYIREGVIYETGATSHAVNDLILFTDNTRELAAMRDSIYLSIVNNAPSNNNYILFIPLLRKAIVVYKQELSDPDSHHHINAMTRQERDEYCQLYADDFENWKKEHDINPV